MFLLTALLQQPGVDPNVFNSYLILGYIVMWIIAMIYIVSLFVRQRNLRQDIELMEHLLQDVEQAADS